MSNTFGTIFRVTTFGESHGPAIGCIVDGCPAGLEFDLDYIQHELDRRRPGQSNIVTQRKESDTVQVLSGVFQGKTLGTPIAFLIKNEDQKAADYDHLSDVFRPGHGDYTWFVKYGHRDHRGGGRSSARETAARVAAGALAKLLLKSQGVEIQGYVSQVGDLTVNKPYTELDMENIETNEVRCPDPQLAQQMIERIKEVRKAGDSLGGVVSAIIKGCPPGLGQPVFDRLEADLAKAMLSINASKGFDIGSGFAGTRMLGSQHNDILLANGSSGTESAGFNTQTNHSGGTLGGISNGMDIYFRVAFKPVSTIMQDQESVNSAGEKVVVKGKGRHDPCVLPRAVPIVEAMTALVLADHLLRARLDQL